MKADNELLGYFGRLQRNDDVKICTKSTNSMDFYDDSASSLISPGLLAVCVAMVHMPERNTTTSTVAKQTARIDQRHNSSRR